MILQTTMVGLRAVANRRERRIAPKRPAPRAIGPQRQPAPTTEHEHQRGSIFPTLVWGALTFIGIALFAALLLARFTQEHLPGTKFAFIGTAFLAGVITLGLFF